MREKLAEIEIEIVKSEDALNAIEMELMEEHPSYETLKKLADDVIKHGKRVRQAIKRDRKYFA